MVTLLRIDTSTRTEGSHSRGLADEVQAQWRKAHPDGEVIVRDLASHPIASIENMTIGGFYTPDDALTEELRQATAVSDELLDELMAADNLLISTPMYNFSIPAVLKAWIDQIVRINRTFAYDENGFHGLLNNKRAYVATAIGAQFTGTPFEAYDFLRPYLRALLGFIGFEQVEIFSVESTTVDETQMNISRQEALSQIQKSFSQPGAATA